MARNTSVSPGENFARFIDEQVAHEDGGIGIVRILRKRMDADQH